MYNAETGPKLRDDLYQFWCFGKKTVSVMQLMAVCIVKCHRELVQSFTLWSERVSGEEMNGKKGEGGRDGFGTWGCSVLAPARALEGELRRKKDSQPSLSGNGCTLKNPLVGDRKKNWRHGESGVITVADVEIIILPRLIDPNQSMRAAAARAVFPLVRKSLLRWIKSRGRQYRDQAWIALKTMRPPL